VAQVGVHQYAPDSRELGDRPQHAHQLRLRIAERSGQRGDADARAHRVQQAEHAVIAGDDACVGCDLAQPLRRAVLRHRLVEPCQRVSPEILHALRLAVPLDILAARVHRPQRVADLAADQHAVVGVAGAQRDVGLAFRKV
jgi:hypothetical protein